MRTVARWCATAPTVTKRTPHRSTKGRFSNAAEMQPQCTRQPQLQSKPARTPNRNLTANPRQCNHPNAPNAT